MNTENQQKNQASSVGCFIIVLLLLIAIPIFYGVKHIATIYSSKNWEKTSAEVKKVDFAFGRRNRTKKVEVAYHYHFKGKKYKGNTIAIGYGLNNIDNHNRIYTILSEAKKIHIFVNPNHPQESLMVLSISDSLAIFILVGLGWVVFSLFLTHHWIIKPEKRLVFWVIFLPICLALGVYVFKSATHIDENISVIENKISNE